jgi:hypothetical protein
LCQAGKVAPFQEAHGAPFDEGTVATCQGAQEGLCQQTAAAHYSKGAAAPCGEDTLAAGEALGNHVVDVTSSTASEGDCEMVDIRARDDEERGRFAILRELWPRAALSSLEKTDNEPIGSRALQYPVRFVCLSLTGRYSRSCAGQGTCSTAASMMKDCMLTGLVFQREASMVCTE